MKNKKLLKKVNKNLEQRISELNHDEQDKDGTFNIKRGEVTRNIVRGIRSNISIHDYIFTVARFIVPDHESRIITYYKTSRSIISKQWYSEDLRLLKLDGYLAFQKRWIFCLFITLMFIKENYMQIDNYLFYLK